MGHYDNFRPGHCAVCGQTYDACGHGRMNPGDAIDDRDRIKRRAKAMADERGHRLSSRQIDVVITMLAELVDWNDLSLPPGWE